MRQLRLDIGDRVYIKGRENEGVWEVYDETFDREGNACYHIHQEDESGCSDESGMYAEELIPEDEYSYGPETCADCQRPEINPWPKFKSYGLTRKQVWEVMNNYCNYMINMLCDLEREAFEDGNYEFSLSYSKDMQIFLKMRLMEDRQWHRFVEE